MSSLKSRVMAGIFVVVASSWTLACADTVPTAPEAPAETAVPAPAAAAEGLSFTLGSEPLLEMIAWTTPRTTAATSSGTIGILGGTVSAGGVTVVIPPLALRQSTRITVTVPAGEHVMADLQPHGLQFRVPPLLLFPLVGTEAGLTSVGLVGVYTEHTPQDGLIQATEVYPTRVLGPSLGFKINHFSNYAPARGGYILIGG